ncbi:MAG: gliding motility-associated C-terminal domain-containing protein [Saprospiraceae bacterium]|nr:gliding motility-associated C-terminal domain-containing protein [Saprospiraceae bacterium]
MNKLIYSVQYQPFSGFCLRLLVAILALFLHTGNILAQDNEPPVILSPARDTSFNCGSTADLIGKLTDWYNNAGGSTASDNSGFFNFQSTMTLPQVISVFNNSLDTLCGNKQKVKVTFFAIDLSGNVSSNTHASFFTTDNAGPTINTVPNVQYNCVLGIRDTLITWIQNKGGYIASDLCSNSVNWTIFQYAIFSGNTIINTGGGNIQNGPYPMIPDGICNWRMNINFFVADECGNQTITPGTTTFTVMDNVDPVFVSPPANITVSCENIPAVPSLAATDYCDKSVIPVLSQTSTRSDDTASCGYYNYLITRIWEVADECGNSASHTQVITVTDVKKPTFLIQPEIFISCKTYDLFRDSIYLYNISDNCSNVSVFFSDTVRMSGCISITDRNYTISDVCGNIATYDQIIHVIQDTNPVITKAATNKEFNCQNQENINALLNVWLQNMGDSQAAPSCGPLLHFAAIKGSYNINDPTTFPGTVPTSLTIAACPSPVNGFLKFAEVDFVYYDVCGNASVTSAIFGISDQNAPVISNCPEPINLATDLSGCTKTFEIQIPAATDDCIESASPVIRTISARVTSSTPAGPESIVDTLLLHIGPFNPSFAAPLSDGAVHIRLKNMDIDDVTEYFNIIGEDGIKIAQSPIGTGQCSNINFDIMIAKNKLNNWIQDGFIDLRFEPNIINGSPVLSINNICSNSSVETTISYDIDISNTIAGTYQINNETQININDLESLSLTLAAGSHNITFNYKDCANNTSTCEVPVFIEDKTKPVITCPSNIISIASHGQCKDTVSLPIDFIVAENCLLDRVYEKVSPASKEAALISFLFNEPAGKYIARNKQIIFADVFPIRHTNLPVQLEVEFFGNNTHNGEFFRILGPGGYVIGSTGTSVQSDTCSIVKTIFEIPYDIFNQWIISGQLTFLAIPNNEPTVEGGGINPCSELLSGQTVDNESYIQAKLKYADAKFSISSAGATLINQFEIDQNLQFANLILNAGINTMTISTKDYAGNSGQCSFEILVKDIESPEANCKNIAISLHPSGVEPYVLKPEEVNSGSSDNCGVSIMTVSPSSFDCTMIGNDVNVTFIAEDHQGNKDTCTSVVKVKSTELHPSFSAGLCSNDTLRLFANVPSSTVPNTYTFHWQGPGNIEFFTENPFIPNVDEAFNGIYILTVTGFNGCTSVGSVLVNIKPLTNPELNTNFSTICEGDDLVLSSTNYSGNIFYEWYQGTFPSGVLLQETQTNEYILKPSFGINFYYVIARGPDCKSNPSLSKRVTILKNPVATVNNLFLSPCEGDNIVLGTSVTNSNFTYFWSGPAGYNETGQFPRVILNANNSHAGKYSLVIKNGDCISDTAVTTVAIFERPLRPTISAADIFCQGATFNMIAINSPNNEKYEWYKDDVLFTTTQDNNLIIPNAQLALQGTWKVRSVKGNCTSEFSPDKAIAIDNLLEIGATNSGPVCAGDSITLLATFVPNATYKWEGPVPNIPSVSSPTIPGIPGDYSVTITTPTFCQNNASTTVTVISVPEITALSNDSKPCMDSTKSISFFPSVFPNNGEYIYQWTSTNGFTSDVKNPVIQYITQKDTGLYTLVIINKGCASDPVSTKVDFTISPPTPVIQTDPFYCTGDSLLISVLNPVENALYIWSTPLGQSLKDTNEFKIKVVQPENAGNYSVRMISKECLSDTSEIVHIEVRTTPQKPLITSNSPVCFGDTLKLSSDFQPDYIYDWMGPTFINNIFNPEIPDVTNVYNGTYTLTISQNNCISPTSAPLEVVILDEIKIPNFTVNTLNTCLKGNIGIELCFDPGTISENSTIKVIHGESGKLIGETNGLCIFIADLSEFKTGANFLYAVSTIGSCQSKSSAPVILNINAPPEINATAREHAITTCPGEFVTLMSEFGPPLVSVKWSALNTENIISDIHAVSPVISGLKPGNNVIFLDYSIDGCPDFSRDTVNIYVEFQPFAENDFYQLDYGQTGLFNVLQNDIFPDQGILTLSELPKYGIATVSGNSITYTPDPRHIEPIVFTYVICGDFCDDLCSEATVNIDFNDNIICIGPNIFTPNNDGMNDQFVIPCLDNERFPGNRLIIFNEWGLEVYLNSPYQNDWEGTFGGNPLPVGTYFYILELGDGQKPINGFLILQR